MEPSDFHVHAQNAWHLFTLLHVFAEGGVFQEQPTHLEAGRLDNIHEAIFMSSEYGRVAARRLGRAPMCLTSQLPFVPTRTKPDPGTDMWGKQAVTTGGETLRSQ